MHFAAACTRIDEQKSVPSMGTYYYSTMYCVLLEMQVIVSFNTVFSVANSSQVLCEP